MAYSPTTLLSLPVISTGTESGVWGDITNNGLTQYLDISIAGALSVTATTTLANTAGTSSTTNIASTTAQYRTIIIPASGPSANIVITAPSSNRAYHVVNRNATYTVQIRAGVNSGVTIGANQSATVAYDSVAADYVLVGPIGPTVPVANGGTGATTLTLNNVILGNGTSAVQFVAPGTNGNVLTSNGTTWTSAALSGVVTPSANNAFTGANTFYNATGQAFAPATTNDGIILQGRAGGSSSYRVTFATATLSANRTLTFPDATDTAAVLGTAQTFTALQTFTGSTSVAATKLTNAKEVATVSATAATGTINYDITTQSVLYYTSNASANWTVNFRGSSGTTLNTIMSTGESITVAFLVTQGSTAYYNNAVQVDGSSVTPKWQGGTAPAAGNASSIDSYVYTIIKTGAATFTVLASQTKFA